MKWVPLTVGLVCAFLLHAGGQEAPAVEDVSDIEQAQWVRWVIPLPKEIAIPNKVDLPASQVKITLRQGAGEVEKTAAQELASLFKDKAGADVAEGPFEILIGVCDEGGRIGDATVADVARLKDLPNREQAYVIRPIGENRLVLTALDERGVYYAAQTLRQLLENTFADGKVTIPLTSVTDWPDLDQRGEWGGLNWFPPDEIEWLARHKMNMVVYGVRFHIREDGRGGVKNIHPDRIAFGRRHALNMVPFITHFCLLGERTNLFQVYPQLKGAITPQGEIVRDLGEANVRSVPCPSQPKMAEVLADFMCAMAAEGATDIDCWLSEGRGIRCLCEKCLGQGDDMHYALEARAYVKAWRIARKQYPKLRVRVTLTQGTYNTNDKVLAEVPPEVGVTYYCSWGTYNSLREPMIYPLLEDFAAKGGRLGVVPQLTATFAAVTPWTAPQFIRTRMNEFVDKKLEYLMGYATYSNRLYDFNVTAAAEWSWNAKGRDEREFATAYATRRRISDPDAFAEWALLLGPVGWDFYGPAMYDFNHTGKLVDMVAGRSDPGLGKTGGMFQYFPTVEHFNEDLAVCEKAMKIATRIGDPGMIAETRVIRGYVSMMKEAAFITTQVSSQAEPTYDDRVDVQNALTRLGMAGLETVDGLETWAQSLGRDLMVYRRYATTLAAVSDMVYGIGDALGTWGVRSFASSYFRKKTGAWNSEDFAEKTRITKQWDVTDHVLVPGTFEVTFKNASHYALDIHRVALAYAPADSPDQLADLSGDKHEGQTAYRSSNANVYTLTLDRLHAGARYFLVADIEGHPAQTLGGVLKHCIGDVWMRALRPENWDGAAAAIDAKPLSDREYAQWTQANVPQFTGDGLQIGVLQDGVGSVSLLEHLRTVEGFNAQALSGVSRPALAKCQVVVVPQPKTWLGPGAVKALEDFVRNGGGLITTHDAVGYRAHPKIITDVCARGVAHKPFDKEWIVVPGPHPVTAGIEAGTPLPHSYYDHVEMERGPNGIVLAEAARTRRPVLLAGDVGKGRYLACGILLGVAADDSSITPTGAERTLLENAVKWCGRESLSRLVPVGEWTSNDFKTKQVITKTWDVTEYVPSTGGLLEVRFNCADHYALTIYRVALASTSAKEPRAITELSADEHVGETGHHHRKVNDYYLSLDDYDPNARYLLIARVKGHASEVLGGALKHCKGFVSMSSSAGGE